MALDINTPKGQKTVAEEQEMYALIRHFFPKSLGNIIETPKERAAAYDGIVFDKNGCMSHVFESKCRQMTFQKMSQRGGTWLITNSKLNECILVAKLSQVPLLGFLYLVPEKTCVIWQITDEKGRELFDYEIGEEETQATCNGGKVTRENAYLPYVNAQIQISYKHGIVLLPGHKDYVFTDKKQ